MHAQYINIKYTIRMKMHELEEERTNGLYTENNYTFEMVESSFVNEDYDFQHLYLQ